MSHIFSHPDQIIGPKPINPVPLVKSANAGYFQRLESRIAKALSLAMVFSIISLGLLMASQVVMRYVIESPFLGVEELAPMLALWGYFLGMVLATREQEHISGGIIALLIKNEVLIERIRLVGTILCLLATLIFGFYAWEFAEFNLKLNRKSIYMRWPKYLWDFSMVLGFALCAFYYFLQIIAEIRRMIGRSNRS